MESVVDVEHHTRPKLVKQINKHSSNPPLFTLTQLPPPRVEKMGALEKTYDDFCEDLPTDDCRYGLIDVEFNTDDGRPTSKLVMIAWNPDTAPIKSKMMYSGSKEAIKRVLVGVGVQINATDSQELDFEESVLPAVKKFA